MLLAFMAWIPYNVVSAEETSESPTSVLAGKTGMSFVSGSTITSIVSSSRRLSSPLRPAPGVVSVAQSHGHTANMRPSGNVPVRIKRTPPLSATGENHHHAYPNALVDGHSVSRVKRVDGFLPPVPDAAATSTGSATKNREEEKKPAWNSLFGVQQRYESNGISVRNRMLRKRYL